MNSDREETIPDRVTLSRAKRHMNNMGIATFYYKAVPLMDLAFDIRRYYATPKTHSSHLEK
jgi:hypothetical protein